MPLDSFDFHLVNDWQRGFPLVSRPYAELAARLGLCEAEVLARLGKLIANGAISRIGPVFRPHTLGASTLAAVSVGGHRVESVAQAISAYPEINHNYEREHEFNLWFVATAPTRERVSQVLGEIADLAGGPVLDLPMVEDFHIDLGFDLHLSRPLPRGGRGGPHLDPVRRPFEAENLALESADYVLAGALEGGLMLTPRPYALLAVQLGWSEVAVAARIAHLIDLGVIRRFGVVVRHRELGYRANAMVVWDVADADVSQVGRALAQQAAVTLCYRRPRQAPHWRYNLFSMLHGQDRNAVLDELARIRRELGLARIDCQPLFSRRRFKQCGARYSRLERAA